MDNFLLISDAAKEVRVESHVLRYWEEELHLPIKRNELGHRYYTVEDVERFKQIKSMKERGLQLKAIKMILKDGKLDVLVPDEEDNGSSRQRQENRERRENTESRDSNENRGYGERGYGERANEEYRSNASKSSYQEKNVDRKEQYTGHQVNDDSEWAHRRSMAIDIVDNRETSVAHESKEDKARRLQWLLQQLIKETLQENNKVLCREIKESVVKELDYQFRSIEEREEERDKLRCQRNEEYYQRMDELLRKKSKFHRVSKDDKRTERKTQSSSDIESSKSETRNKNSCENEAVNTRQRNTQAERPERNADDRTARSMRQAKELEALEGINNIPSTTDTKSAEQEKDILFDSLEKGREEKKSESDVSKRREKTRKKRHSFF